MPNVPRPVCVGGTEAEWDEYWTLRDEHYGIVHPPVQSDSKRESFSLTDSRSIVERARDNNNYEDFFKRRMMKNGPLGTVI